jgi:hypothetical protein
MADPIQPKLRLKDRRRRLAWVKVAAGASVVAIAIALVFYVSHLPQITIATVDVSGTDLVSADEVHALVSQELAGSYAFIVPRANAFVIPIGSIRTAIKDSFPPVANVSVSTKGLTALAVAITERQAAALWCAGIPSGEIANDSNNATSSSVVAGSCYLMDSSGFVFAPSATTTGYMRFYGGLSGNPVGSTYLGGGYASLQGELQDIASSIHLTPQEVLVDNGGTDVSIAFAEGGVVRFIRTADVPSTVENIASVFASQSFQQNTRFEYADFRFGDKVYVKFK